MRASLMTLARPGAPSTSPKPTWMRPGRLRGPLHSTTLNAYVGWPYSSKLWLITHHLIVVQLMAQVHKQHSRDPNFPIQIIDKIEQFLGG